MDMCVICCFSGGDLRHVRGRHVNSAMVLEVTLNQGFSTSAPLTSWAGGLCVLWGAVLCVLCGLWGAPYLAASGLYPLGANSAPTPAVTARKSLLITQYP